MMHWLDTGRTALRYELSGAGASTLVLVHEMGGTLESWDHVLPELAAGRRVLRYDTRGAGQSEKARGVLSLDAMAGDVVDLLDEVGISGRVAIAGCAVGAAIALQFVVRFPERVAALVAMSPAVGVPAERRTATLARAEQVERKGMRGIVEESFAASYPPEVRHDAEHYQVFRARWLAGDPASYAAIYRMLVNSELEGELGRIACPTLVVAGTLDRLRPPAVVEAVATAIPGARMVVVESGHFMATQTPGLVAGVIGGFLREVGI